MCLPKAPKTTVAAVEPAPAVQPAQEPQVAELNAMKKKRIADGGMSGGTLLTGASGVATSSLSTGGATLLGS